MYICWCVTEINYKMHGALIKMVFRLICSCQKKKCYLCLFESFVVYVQKKVFMMKI